MRSIVLFLFTLILIQCRPIHLYERTANIPGHAWKSDFRPSFPFEITDTASSYQVSLILRHTDAYPYNNIWLDIGIQTPDTSYTIRTEKKLGDNEHGWLGTGLNDVYEHRIPLGTEVSFQKAGTYTFQLTQIMREDPLPNVLQAGIRVERNR